MISMGRYFNGVSKNLLYLNTDMSHAIKYKGMKKWSLNNLRRYSHMAQSSKSVSGGGPESPWFRFKLFGSCRGTGVGKRLALAVSPSPCPIFLFSTAFLICFAFPSAPI